MIIEYIEKFQKRILTEQDDYTFLEIYSAEWSTFFTQCNSLSLLFRPLEKKSNKHYFSFNSQYSVLRLMLDTWNDYIFCNNKDRLTNSAMKLIHKERNGEPSDLQLIVAIRDSYVNVCTEKLKLYYDNFEKSYIQEIKTYYKASRIFEDMDVENYIKYIDQVHQKEQQLASKYLIANSKTFQNVTDCCVKILVMPFKERIVAEYKNMIKNKKLDKLHEVFNVMSQIPGVVNPLLYYLELQIIDQGIADMKASAEIITQDPEKYVEQLVKFITFFSKLKESSNNEKLIRTIDVAFKTVVNDTSVFKLELSTKSTGLGRKEKKNSIESRCPELLAYYCNMFLKKSSLSKKYTSDEIESKLQQVLQILKIVKNKDVFMNYYSSHLIRRIILNTSVDSEIEGSMIEWLQNIGIPFNYIYKLKRMFQDIKINEDLNRHFKDVHRNDKGNITYPITVMILNALAYEHAEHVQVSLPLELENFIPVVEEFYRHKYNGRKLQWYHRMSNGTITFSNLTGNFDLNVTMFQMVVLFVWNQRPNDRISFENLQLATELPNAELQKTLWSLVAFPKLKHQVLLFSPNVETSKDFNDSTLFWINEEFAVIKNKKLQKRGKVNLIGQLKL